MRSRRRSGGVARPLNSDVRNHPMEQRQISGGTKWYFGAPANPMPPERAAAIAALVARVPGIVEAHVPQCFVEGDSAARQVLAIVVTSKAEIPRIAGELGAGLKAIVPAGQFLDILPFPASAVMPGVREARCQIFPVSAKPWWRVW